MNFRLSLLLAGLFLLSATDAEAQRRRNSEPVWPPERAYGRTTLGHALQNVFGRHYDFCGFTKPTGRRDYTPPTIDRFLGKRSLRTRVEQADINGGNLLSYIFTAEETGYPLDKIRYRPDLLLYSDRDGVNLTPEPRPGFDAFLLTKNCSGYLKASLDAGLKPPYASFHTALETDGQRKSTVVAMAGSFLSPLTVALGANDARTTELMATLWRFYERHPEYVGKAYYLTQFEGVLIKHLTDATAVSQAEVSLGVNVAVPLVGKLGAEGLNRRTSDNNFAGTDWETIVYADFEGPYQRDRLYAPLPTPQQIVAYFRGAPGLAAAPATVDPLREGGVHLHRTSISGLPAELAGAGWRIENLRGGAYRGTPQLRVNPAGEQGLNFAISGQVAPDLFPAGQPGAIATVPLYYELVLPGRNGLPALRLPVTQRIPTSAHPLVDLTGVRFELQRKNNNQYAFRWYLTLNVEDRDNPLDPAAACGIEDIRAGYTDAPLDLTPISITYDERRATVTAVLETERTWALQDVDDRHMQTMPLRAELLLPVRNGYDLIRRPVVAKLAVPRIQTTAVQKLD